MCMFSGTGATICTGCGRRTPQEPGICVFCGVPVIFVAPVRPECEIVDLIIEKTISDLARWMQNEPEFANL